RCVGGQAIADGVRMGSSRGGGPLRGLVPEHPKPPSAPRRRWAGIAPDVRRRLGMDPLVLRPLSRLPAAGRCRGRVQRQVHGRTDGTTRRFVRDAARPRPDELPKLLPARRAVAVQRDSAGGGCMIGLEAAMRTVEADAFVEALLVGLHAKPKRIPPKFFYDDEGSRLFEEI